MPVFVIDRSRLSLPVDFTGKKKTKNVLGAKEIIFIFCVFKVLQCTCAIAPQSPLPAQTNWWWWGVWGERVEERFQLLQITFDLLLSICETARFTITEITSKL